MANALYDAGRNGFLKADNDWDSDHRVVLTDNGAYTVSLSTHDFLDDVAGGSRIAVSATLGSPTGTAGVADASDTSFTSVTGTSCESLVIYQHTGTDSTSDLVLYLDTATGLPVTPNGGNINVTWDNGANKIFKL